MGLGDVLHKSYDALKTYSRVRNFITIISDRYGLAREIDSFYYHIHHLIISKDEMLEMLSLDYYYKLAYHKVAQIRVEYQRQNRTLILNAKQQEELRTAIQCVGRQIGLYPINP